MARTLGDQVAASPLFWLNLPLSAGLLWRRRALTAAIQKTAVPLANPTTDRFGHTLRAAVGILLVTFVIMLACLLASGISQA